MGQDQENKQDNNDQNENQNQDQNQNKGRGGGGGKSLLDYSLVKLECAVAFKINNQHKDITNFLKEVGIYRAENGMMIKLGILHPEWKDSLNTIYLDGTDGRNIKNPDITYFASNWAANNRIGMLKTALEELVTTVKSLKPDKSKRERANVDRIRLN